MIWTKLGILLIGFANAGLLPYSFSILKNGVNGATELLFINGISLWVLFVTAVTFLS